MNFDRHVKRAIRAAAVAIKAAQQKDREYGVLPPGWEIGQRPVFTENAAAERLSRDVDAMAEHMSVSCPVGHPDAVRIVWAVYTSWEVRVMRMVWINAAMSLLNLGMSPNAIVTAIHAARAVEAVE